VPGYVAAEASLRALGVEEVIFFAVNDGAVMGAFAHAQRVDRSRLITMMGDPSGVVTEALGMALTHPTPMYKMGYRRCKRFAMYLEDGVILVHHVAEQGPDGQEDPAGDDFPEAVLPDAMAAAIKALGEPGSRSPGGRTTATPRAPTGAKRCG